MLDLTHLATLFIGGVIGFAIGGIYHLVSARSARRRHNEVVTTLREQHDKVVTMLAQLTQAVINNGSVEPVVSDEGELSELRTASGNVVISVPAGTLSLTGLAPSVSIRPSLSSRYRSQQPTGEAEPGGYLEGVAPQIDADDSTD